MRPGGLTALAIFNFVFGGLAGIAALLNLATLGTFYDKMAESAQHAGTPFPTKGVLYALAVFGLVRAGVLITAGIGYLGRKRFVGWVMGNAYAVLALVAIVVEITLTPTTFTAFNLMEFAYPLITLFLLNAVFRKDFAR